MRLRVRLRVVLGFVFAAAAFASADKKLPLEKSSNELAEISASVLIDKDEIRQVLGAELPAGIVVVKVTVRTLSEKSIAVSRDDFALLSTGDGQRSTPYAPSQIAGNSRLVVGSQGTRGGIGAGGNGPIWGGIPGVGGGRPQRLPGNGGGVGNAGSQTEATATIKADGNPQESPLLKSLKEKVLPEQDVKETLTGLLYFQMEGKVKAKDLELYYKSPAGKLALRFRP